ALPVLVYVIMKIMTLTGVSISTEVMLVILMMASAPAASSATMFAERYDCDAAYVSKLVTVSTLLSILTMPLITMLAYL
ncbi:MAG: AEC family transporter, partial [Clostridia bacterium]|nr:AEC family transporter [Clostridia bacterium]